MIISPTKITEISLRKTASAKGSDIIHIAKHLLKYDDKHSELNTTLMQENYKMFNAAADSNTSTHEELYSQFKTGQQTENCLADT